MISKVKGIGVTNVLLPHASHLFLWLKEKQYRIMHVTFNWATHGSSPQTIVFKYAYLFLVLIWEIWNDLFFFKKKRYVLYLNALKNLVCIILKVVKCIKIFMLIELKEIKLGWLCMKGKNRLGFDCALSFFSLVIIIFYSWIKYCFYRHFNLGSVFRPRVLVDFHDEFNDDF